MSWVWKHSFSISGRQALSLKCFGRRQLHDTGYGGFCRALPAFARDSPLNTGFRRCHGSIVSGARDFPPPKRELFLGNQAINHRSYAMGMLNACATTGTLDAGRAARRQIFGYGVLCGGSLIEFYRKCWSTEESFESVQRGAQARERGIFLELCSLEAEVRKVEAEEKLTLVKKKCTPCSSKELQPVKQESAESLLEQIPGWNLLEVNGQLQLEKSWKAKSFLKGLEFIQSIANVAESEGHHPDLHIINWNDVKANLWTHSIGGLTENDFILAAKINTISTEGFLRKIVKKAVPKPPPEAT